MESNPSTRTKAFPVVRNTNIGSSFIYHGRVETLYFEHGNISMECNAIIRTKFFLDREERSFTIHNHILRN